MTATAGKIKAHFGGTVALDLNAAPPQMIDWLKGRLSLLKKGYMGQPDEQVPFWFEQGNWFHLPKGFLFSSEGATILPYLDIQDDRTLGSELGELRTTATFGVPPFPPEQPKFIDAIVRGAQTNGHGGIATAPTRSGKTYCTLEAACRLGRKTLILVDRGILEQQWRMAIEGDPADPKSPRVVDANGFGVKSGTIREREFEIRYPFTIAMIQTLSKRVLSDEVRKAFGTVILDECSAAVTRMVLSALQRVDARYLIGLSATPHDAGSLAPAVEWTVGPVIASLRRDIAAEIRYLHVPYSMTTRAWCENKRTGGRFQTRLSLTRGGDTDIIAAEKMLMADEGRVAIIAAHVTAAKNDGRRVLVVAGLREHVAILAREIERVSGYKPGIMIAGADETAQKAMQRDIVVATRQLVAKGTDFKPPATAMFIVCPIAKVEQLVGRVLQPQSPVLPLVVVVVDGATALVDLAKEQDRFYRNRGFMLPNPVWPSDMPVVSG